MALQTAQVNGRADRFDAVRYTDRDGNSTEFLVEDSFPGKTPTGVTYMLVGVQNGKFRRSDLLEEGWTFI